MPPLVRRLGCGAAVAGPARSGVFAGSGPGTGLGRSIAATVVAAVPASVSGSSLPVEGVDGVAVVHDPGGGGEGDVASFGLAHRDVAFVDQSVMDRTLRDEVVEVGGAPCSAGQM